MDFVVFQDRLPIMCISHGGCADGITAAHIVRKWAATNGITFVHHPTQIRSFVKDTAMPPLENHHVIIVDYSYSREEIDLIRGRAKSLHIFDHHLSAKEQLEGVEGVFFDMTRCGAEIVFDYFFKNPGTDADSFVYPWYLKFVAIRDLWKWDQLSDTLKLVTKSFGAAFATKGYTFETLDEFDRAETDQIEYIIDFGAEKLSDMNRYVDELSAISSPVFIDGYRGLMVVSSFSSGGFAPDLVRDIKSEIGAVLNKHNDCDVAIVVEISLHSPDCWISLRSSNGTNVATIAASRGGGGHASAAGFTFVGGDLGVIFPPR